MSKGIAAFVVVLAVTLSMSILSGVGYYDSLNLDYSDDQYNDDVQSAADALTNQGASDSGGSPISDFTTGAANTLKTFWEILSNTSGILQLLFSLPKAVADPIETLFQIGFGISFLGFIRGVMID